MQKCYIASGIISMLFSGSVMAYDGTINFIGKVVDQTCSVKSGSDNLTVTLPTVSKTALATPAKTAALTPFVIELSGCNPAAAEGAKKVKAYFEPNATTDATTGNLNIEPGAGKATGVQIQLLNADGSTPIKLGKDVAAQGVTAANISAADVKLTYNTQYYATAVATPGDVKATVNYTISYE
ncbi:TPA: fimbrial protein [Morganella morganii]